MTDFGGTLREARERRGISIRQIAASTKIPPATLEALERNNVARLPGGIFTRAIVRAYAAEIGLPPEDTLRDFLSCFEPPPPAPIAEPETVNQIDDRQRMAALVVGVALISILAAGAILLLTLKRQSDSRPPNPPVAAEVSDDRESVDPAESGFDDGTPSSNAATPVEAQPPAPPVREDVVAAVDGALRLDLHPSGNCWVNLTVDGERVLARVVESGERLSFDVDALAVVQVGDAGVFEYSLNGSLGRPLGGSGQVRTARISPETLDTYLR